MPNQIEITAEIKGIVYSTPASPWRVVSARDLSKPKSNTIWDTLNDISAVGNIPGAKGDQVRLEGYWEEHPQYGHQLKVTRATMEIPQDPDGVAAFLARKTHGLGPVGADRLVKKLGVPVQFPDDLDPLAKELKLKVDVLERAREVLEENEGQIAAQSQLLGMGLTERMALALLKDCRNPAGLIAEIRSDPYSLPDRVRGIGFKISDRIARDGLGIAPDDPMRLRAGLVHAVKADLQQGHTWVDLDSLLVTGHDLLGLSATQQPLPGTLDDLVADGRLRRIPEHDAIALPEIHDQETDILRVLGERNREVDDAPEIERDPQSETTAEQWNAIELAVSRKISGWGGPAGCGKTFTAGIAAMILRGEGKTVKVCAPTGKAARRIEAKLGVGWEASTVHRLLKFNPELGWGHNPEKPLEADVVIVDESSMLDSALLWHLLRGVRPDAQVIFTGDPHQLPPVSPGYPWRDLRQRKLVPLADLTQVHRHAGSLQRNATALLSGHLAPTSEPEPGMEFPPWLVLDQHKSAPAVLSTVVRMVTEVLPGWGIDLADIQVLAPMYAGVCGIDQINLELQTAVQRKKFNRDLPPADCASRQDFYSGDRLLWLRNNYRVGVMNGQTGVVLEAEGKNVFARFDDTEVEIKGPDLGQVKLGWCISIHKSQGSEWPATVLVQHSSSAVMLSRQLLYTGCTRAGKHLSIVGDEWGLQQALANNEPFQRRTLTSIL